MVPERLLIIDDNDDTLTLVKFIVENYTDWQIFTASSGKVGITKAIIERPDVILLDIAMPDIDGLDIYKLLKSNKTTRSISIIFLTAVMNGKEIVRSQVGEEIEVITKPFDILELLNKVNKAYNNSLALSS